MNTFNLTFRGSVLPGYDSEKVKVAFGKYFENYDQKRIDELFTGISTVLRDGLDRKTAAALYVELHKMGLDVILVKAASENPSSGAGDEDEDESKNDNSEQDVVRPRGMDHEIREAAPGRIDQSWPVSRARPTPAQQISEATSSSPKTDQSIDQSNTLARQKKQLQQRTEKQELSRQAKRDADAMAAIEKADENARQVAQKDAQNAALIQEKTKQKALRLAAKQAADKDAIQAKAQRLEVRSLASEQAAQRRAEKNRQKRDEAAEKARVHAGEKRQKAEQATAAKQEKVAENQRRAEVKQAAKLRAAQEAKALKAERLSANQQAAETARQQQEERERAKESLAVQSRKEHERKLLAKRQQSEENARQREAQLLEKRQEAERHTAEKAERKRKHAEEFAILEQRKAAERARHEALARAAREKAAREALEHEALQAEQRRLEAEETARLEAEKLASLESLESQESQDAVSGGTPPLAVPEPVTEPKPAKKKAASKKDIPSTHQAATIPRGKAGPGAPNMYQLRPFRNSLLVQGRAARSSQTAFTGFMISLVAFVALIALTVRFFVVDPVPTPSAAHAAVSNSKDDLYLFVADQVLIHDRSGVAKDSFGIKTLGLQQTSQPMAFLQNDHLVVRALAANQDAQDAKSDPWSLFNCDLSEQRCAIAALPPEVTSIDAMALEPRTDVRYIASNAAGQLFKVSAKGELLGAIEIKLPPTPTLRLNSGLIYLGSANAPAISVLRPDNQAFGQQLDEILLLPAPAVAQQHSRVGDFIWSLDHWWVILYHPETLDAGVYRFDDKWKFIGQLALADNSQPQALLGWSDKVLILESNRQKIQRFSRTGEAEQALGSESLSTYISGRADDNELTSILWRISLGLLAIVFFGALGFAYLHRLRSLVYKTAHETGAPPLNEKENLIQWIEPASTSSVDPRVLAMAYLGFTLSALLLSIALMVSPIVLLAILILLSGPPIAYLFLLTSPQGHLGTLVERLLLVDHQSVYQLGEGAKIRYRSQFLMIDDVVVYTGATLWPVFNSTQMRKYVEPLVVAGVKVDIATLVVRLLEAWHPIAKAALIIVGCTLGAGLIAATSWL